VRSLIGKTISHYTILAQIGRGGMGIVYRARDQKLDRTVALKFLPLEFTNNPAARERFTREARAASSLQHNNICSIHDIDQTANGQLFICMDFYEGETLKNKLERGLLTTEQATEIARQLAQGLAEAHRHGIVHRDIKPANIFITSQGVVKILDFGLAKLGDGTWTSARGSTAGTPAYMSPEQTRGEELDRRTDIWSFGVVLYEMLTGRRPFTAEHPLALMYEINNEEPPDGLSLRGEIPADLNGLCRSCLRKRRDERLADLAETALFASPPASRLRRLARLALTLPRPLRWGAAAASVVALVLLLWLLSPSRTISLGKSDLVVVADVENRTDDRLLDHSLSQGLKVSLRQSGLINIIPPDQISSARELLRVPPEQPLDERTALAVARREGARAVISPNISKLGSMYVLLCGVIDASTGETVQILRQEVDRIEGVLSALDELCRDLRESLGESLAQISSANYPLAQVTTASLEALELYSRSERLASEGKYGESGLLLEKAVAIDSQFVMAISDLAYAYRKTGKDSLASVMHYRILPLIHRATERERLEILAAYYGPSFELDFRKAYEQLQQVTVKYPANALAFATLGHLAMYAGDTKGALAANAQAVALTPAYDRTCYNNSAFALALDGEGEEALSWFRRAKALRPDYVAIDNYMAQTFWILDEFDSAQAILRRTTATPDLYSRHKGRVICASLDLARGELRAARGMAQAGVEECRAEGKPEDEAYFHLLLGEIAAAGGEMREYRAQLYEGIALAGSPYFDLALAGISFARRGFVREAEEILGRIGSARSFDPYFIRHRGSFLGLIRGQIDLAAGRGGEARRHFEGVGRIKAGDPFYLLALRGAADCAALASDTSAPRLYLSLLSRKGEMVMGNLSSIRHGGAWTRWLWADVYLDLGKLHAARGRRELALAALERCQEYWRDADPADLRAAEARSLLQRTRGE
jgi:serine/threonine protein kinase/tetratricopeptide (TPR) repeat protein